MNEEVPQMTATPHIRRLAEIDSAGSALFSGWLVVGKLALAAGDAPA